MKLFRKTKLNQLGFSLHFIMPVLVIAAVTFVGVKIMFASHADPITVNLSSPIEGMAGNGTNNGYWLFSPDGGVFAEGSAPFYGSMGGKILSAQIAGMSATTDHKGYYLVGADGAVYAFGDAKYSGGLNGGSSYGVISHPGTVIGIAAHNGGGYWIMTSTGAVYALGGAPFYGNYGTDAGTSIKSIIATPSGNGYWATNDIGHVYGLGDAWGIGQAGGTIHETIGIAPAGKSYVLITAAGGVNAPNSGYLSTSPQNIFGTNTNPSVDSSPFVGVASTGDNSGYWMVQANGTIYSYGDAQNSYTTPLKFSRAGGWSSDGTNDSYINTSGSQIYVTDYVCRLQVGGNLYVAGYSSTPQPFPANANIQAMVFSPDSLYEAYTSYLANTNTYRSPFILVAPNETVTMKSAMGYGGNHSVNLAVSSLVGCSQ